MSLFVVVAGLVLPAVASARPGDVDRGFSADGRVTLPGRVPRLVAIAASSAGGLSVLAEERSSPSLEPGAVFRLSPGGALDAGFGQGGVARVPALTPAGFVVDDRRRTVVLGWHAVGGDSETGVVRLTADGTVDPGFGTGGLVRVPGNASLSAPPVERDGEIGFARSIERRLILGRLDEGGRSVAERVIPLPASFTTSDVLNPVSLIGPPRGMTAVGVEAAAATRRSVLVGPRRAVVVGGALTPVVGVGTDLVGVRSFFRPAPSDQLALDRIQLERRRVSGRLRWRLPLSGRLRGLRGPFALASAGDGRTYAASPITGSGDDLRLAVLRVTREGRLDRTFGRRGLLVHRHVAGDAAGDPLPLGNRLISDVALASAPRAGRLFVGLQDRQREYNFREESGDPHVTVIALRTG